MANVTIRDLAPEVHAALVARAAREGRSLQQFLTRELTLLVARPTLSDVFEEIRARGDTVDLTAEEIVDAIERGREHR